MAHIGALNINIIVPFWAQGLSRMGSQTASKYTPLALVEVPACPVLARSVVFLGPSRLKGGPNKGHNFNLPRFLFGDQVCRVWFFSICTRGPSTCGHGGGGGGNASPAIGGGLGLAAG